MFGSLGAWRAVVASALLAAVGLAVAAEQVQKLATPAWVEPVDPPPASAAVDTGNASTGTAYLLVDSQTRVEPGGGKQSFRHYAMLARDTKGVESLANIDVAFDPSYQTLALHQLLVHRNGQVQDRLRSAQVRVLQRERELETLIYDGSRNASIFLDDVRVGDVIEYAYSITGSNPVFGGRSFGAFDLQWGQPLARLRIRLLWPSARPLKLRTAPGDAAVAQRAVGAFTEYRVERDGIAGLRVESDAPGWYDPYPTLYWSEFTGWPDVAAWALPLYRVPTELPAPLRAERDRILAAHREPAERAAAALRWVQGEIRYLGIEVGANSHAPNPPALVVSRRFGDCKDKTLLTVTLLRALGLQAEPALVHTQLKRGVDRGLPGPGAFNHVIVRLTLDGRTYWLDPTGRPQPGTLDQLSQPDWGLALPVNAEAKGLVAMASGDASRTLRKVKLLLDATAGLAAPATLTVTSELAGKTAEAERAAFADDGAERVQQRYLNFYAKDYPGLKVAAPIELVEEPGSNRLRVVEHYEMPRAFVPGPGGQRVEATLESPEVRSLLGSPNEPVRQAPLALRHPMQLEHEVEMRLPETWPLKAKVTEVSNGAFLLRHELRGEQPENGEYRVIKLIDRYESRAEQVEPEAVAGYAADLEKARASLGYTLYKTENYTPPSDFNLTVAFFVVIVAMSLAWVLPPLYRWDPVAPAGSPQPFNGWLLLISLSVIAVPLRLLFEIPAMLPAFGLNAWNQWTLPGGEHYHPWMTLLLLAELATQLVLLGTSLLLAVLFFQRRSSAPRLFVAVFGLFQVFAGMDGYLSGYIPALAEQATPQSPGLWGASWLLFLIYSAYLLKNERARRSFTRRYRPETPRVDPADAPPIIPA